MKKRPKTTLIGVRLTEEELAELDAVAQQFEGNRSMAIRKMIHDAYAYLDMRLHSDRKYNGGVDKELDL